MRRLLRHFPLLLTVLAFVGVSEFRPARADLMEYVQKADDSFSFKLVGKLETQDGILYNLELVSQTWQDIRWTHRLQVFVPTNTKPGATMLLYITGNPNPLDTIMGFEMATRLGAPVAFLFNVPNQPLLEGKSEDALIAETFVRYLETGDGSWPLLFPMVKSVVKAMDALQAFCRTEFGVTVGQFVLAGASKRGWTTWLTAATDRNRVRALAPMVIDVLNMPAQMAHQKKSFGEFSAMIRDYTTRKLVPIPDTPRAKGLWQMVDPFAYRDKITQPTMIVLGSNDPYWTVDSLNLYWNELKSKDRWVLMVPNAGHDLNEKLPDGKRSRERALSGLVAFARANIDGPSFPKLDWTFKESPTDLLISVTPGSLPKAARVWTTTAPTTDFRKQMWTSRPLDVGEKTPLEAHVDRPKEGFMVAYVELDYQDKTGLTHRLTTQTRVCAAVGREK